MDLRLNAGRYKFLGENLLGAGRKNEFSTFQPLTPYKL